MSRWGAAQLCETRHTRLDTTLYLGNYEVRPMMIMRLQTTQVCIYYYN